MNIPKGYKLVPVEPTDQMYLAFCEARGRKGSTYRDGLREAISVASAPPQPIYDEAKERELFEAWSADHVYLGGCSMHTHSGEYDDIDVQYSWEAWESRAKSVEVGDE